MLRTPFSHLDSASLHPGSILAGNRRGVGVSVFVAAEDEENEEWKRKRQGTDEMATSTWLELSDCCGHGKDVPDLEHHHTKIVGCSLER